MNFTKEFKENDHGPQTKHYKGIALYSNFIKMKIMLMSFHFACGWPMENAPWRNMRLVTTKPVFGVSNKVKFKPACSATQRLARKLKFHS